MIKLEIIGKVATLQTATLGTELSDIEKCLQLLRDREYDIKEELKIRTRDPKICAIARLLHDKYCRADHTSICGWFYAPDDWSESSHVQYYEKAARMADSKVLRNASEEDVEEFVRRLTSL